MVKLMDHVHGESLSMYNLIFVFYIFYSVSSFGVNVVLD